MKAWNQVQQSLARLSSGIQFEPVIMLRSKMADADAAIKGFESDFRIFPADKKERVDAGKRGIRYLDIALNDAKGINRWEDMAHYAEVTRWIPRSCAGDKLTAFSRETVKETFAISGSYLIRKAAGEVTDKGWEDVAEGAFFSTLELSKETAECQQQYASAMKKAEEEKKATAKKADEEKKAAKYHIDVYNPENCLMTAYADGKQVFHGFDPGSRFHLDANKEARLSEVSCQDNPANSIRVKINGHDYVLNWVKKGYSEYTAVLAPIDH